MLLTVLGAALLASISDLSGLLLFWKKGWARRYSLFLVSFAAGALLGAAFLEVIPEALEEGGSFLGVLEGILVFYVLERVIFLHHVHVDGTVGHAAHPGEEDAHGPHGIHPSAYLMFFGNTLHDMVDGIIIALTFLVDFELGVLTTIAVVAHEFPAGIGEFSVLLHGGVKEAKAVLYVVLTILATPLGALTTLALASTVESVTGPLMALAAGGFIYIAAVDLIPETHREFNRRRSLVQGALLVFGILIIYLVGAFLG